MSTRVASIRVPLLPFRGQQEPANLEEAVADRNRLVAEQAKVIGEMRRILGPNTPERRKLRRRLQEIQTRVVFLNERMKPMKAARRNILARCYELLADHPDAFKGEPEYERVLHDLASLLPGVDDA